MRLDDGVEVAAVGHVHRDFAQAFDLGAQPLGVKEARHVGQADLFDKAALLAVGDIDLACGRFNRQFARFARLDQAVFDTHGDGADGAMAAHRQAARGFNKQHRHIAISPRRRIKDRARHHVMPARFEHQTGADPVKLAQEMSALFQHVRALKSRTATRDKADRIAAGVPVDAGKGMAGHGLEPLRRKEGQVDRWR